jgi:hypothetical protein
VVGRRRLNSDALLPRAYSPCPCTARDISVHRYHGTDHDAIADRYTFLDYRIAGRYTRKGDLDWCWLDDRENAAETPALRRAVRGDLSADGDVAMVPDRKSALPVESGVRTLTL